MKKSPLRLLLVVILLPAFIAGCSEKSDSEFGIFNEHSDIGECRLPGNFVHYPEKGLYSMLGSGENIWFASDQFHYAWLETDKDFILRAKIEFIGEGKNAHRKIGIMVRNSIDTSSVHASGVVHGDGLTALQFRKVYGEDTEEIKSEASAPDAIQMERKGNKFIFTVAQGDQVSEPMVLEELSLDHGALVGLFICSHDNSVAEKANFSEVEILYKGRKDHESFETYLLRE